MTNEAYLKNLVRRLTRHSPWEIVNGDLRCYFCGKSKNKTYKDTDARTHHEECAYVDARNLYGGHDE
jgi:hypothetical protein